MNTAPSKKSRAAYTIAAALMLSMSFQTVAMPAVAYAAEGSFFQTLSSMFGFDTARSAWSKVFGSVDASTQVGQVAAAGTPSVTGVSGMIAEGQNITISGTGFGANGPRVVHFDNFENGNDGDVVPLTATIGGYASRNDHTHTRISTDSSVSGTRAWKGDMSISDAARSAIRFDDNPWDVFISYWNYVPAGDALPGEGTVAGINWKSVWLLGNMYGGAQEYGNNDLVVPVYLGTYGKVIGGNGSPFQYYMNNTRPQGTWMRHWLWFKGGINNDGEFKFWELQKDTSPVATQLNKTNLTTLFDQNPGHPGVNINGWQRYTSLRPARQYFDDFYVATGPYAQARVEIGNASTYMGSTNLTILTPNSWSDSSINATVRAGSFTAGQTAYLYVFDANGNVNTAGYPVAINGNINPVIYACSDTIDNDNDGLVDLADPGCTSNTDNDEYNAPAPSSGPVAEWLFDEGAGTTANDSAGNNDASLKNGTAWTTGAAGNAVYFDGTNDAVSVPDNASLDFGTQTDFTVSAWVKLNSTTGNRSLISKVQEGTAATDGGWAFYYNSNNNLALDITSDTWNYYCGLVSPVSLSDGSWHHVAATINRSGSCTTNDIALFADGIKLSGTATGGNIGTNVNLDNNDPLLMGAYDLNGSYNSLLRGAIDNVRIYNRALTATEVADIAANTTPPAPTYACSDNIDNDGDGLVDLADPGCTSTSDNDEYNAPAIPITYACSDTSDNDADGLVDYPADPGCTSISDNDEYNAPATSGTSPSITLTANPTNITSGESTTLTWSSTNATACASADFSTNNQLNGSVSVSPTTNTTYTIACTGTNGADTSSVTITVSAVTPTYACSDSIDNDADGLIDYPADTGCTSATDNDESDAPVVVTIACADSIDNDGDGLIDLQDPGCSAAWDTDEYNDPIPPTFEVGARVKVNVGGGNLNVRNSSGKRIGKQADGAYGTIVNGSFSRDGYTWWEVDFDSGTDGWVAEAYLTLSDGSGLGSGDTGTAGPYVFTRNLGRGDTGADVRQLQVFLNAHGFVLKANGAGAPGSETDYYGKATEDAVTKFQNAYAAEVLTPLGLTAGTGYFGDLTRQKVNQILASE